MESPVEIVSVGTVRCFFTDEIKSKDCCPIDGNVTIKVNVTAKRISHK